VERHGQQLSLARFEETLGRIGAFFTETSPVPNAAADITDRLTELGDELWQSAQHPEDDY